MYTWSVISQSGPPPSPRADLTTPEAVEKKMLHIPVALGVSWLAMLAQLWYRYVLVGFFLGVKPPPPCPRWHHDPDVRGCVRFP